MTARTYYANREKPFQVDAIELGADGRSDAITAVLGSTINFSIADLQSYFYASWRPELVDLLVIAAAVEYCDFRARRPALGWARSFDLRVAVHSLDRWEDPAVHGALEEALSFLTGDHWIVSFVKREHDLQPVEQASLSYDVCDRVIMPYSDGVDSHAVSALVDHAEGGGLVRVRLGTGGADAHSTHPRERRFMSVPYRVRFESGQRVESSARSRGFKFAVITGIAAALADVDRIVVTESGQGALGAILATVGQSYPDYRVHPAFTRRIEELFYALTGKMPHYEYPRIWSTKGETVAAAQKLAMPPDWANTRSCWQGARQVSFEGKLRQCGICVACMLRRQSMHAAGVEEPAANYIWEDLAAPKIEEGAVSGFTLMTNSLREYAIAGVLHLDHLASLADSSLHRRAVARVARETANGLSIPSADAEKKLLALLARHRAEWLAFQESLGPTSFVTELAQVSPWHQ